MDTQTAYIGIGSNLSWLGRPPGAVVPAAARALARLGSLRLSPLYDSPAWPNPSGPAYVNAVAALETALAPEAVLAACQAIEAGFGRRRDAANRNASRTLDLDLLALGGAVIETETLTLPHPRLAARDFVLAPLRDLAPGWRHPVSGRPIADLLAEVAKAAVKRPNCDGTH